MDTYRNTNTIVAYTAPDGALIKEVAGHSTGLASQSLAVITHPAGTTSLRHHHRTTDEIYLITAGSGRFQVGGESFTLSSGEALIIRAGQPHKLWNDGPADLVLLVTCAPAYDVNDVVWDE